nr:MAG TPA: Apo-citrate lyase phosphoribosyl-dephospho-CoA transferase [Bacteriophage sp.]
MKDYKQVLKDALVNITGMFLTMPRVKALQKAEDGQSVMLTMDDGNGGVSQIEAHPVGNDYFGLDTLEDAGKTLTEAYGEGFELFRIYCGLYEAVYAKCSRDQRHSLNDIGKVIESVKDDIAVMVASKTSHSGFVKSLEKVRLFITRLNLMGVKTDFSKSEYLHEDFYRIEMVFPSKVAGNVVYNHGFDEKVLNEIRFMVIRAEGGDLSKSDDAIVNLLYKKPVVSTLNAFLLLSYIIEYLLDVEYLARTHQVEANRHDLTMAHNIRTLWEGVVSDVNLSNYWMAIKHRMENGPITKKTIEIKSHVSLWSHV